MKIKKLIPCFVFAVLCAAALFSGCSGESAAAVDEEHTVIVNKMRYGQISSTFTLTVSEGEGVDFGMLIENYPDEFNLDSGFWSNNCFYTDEDCTVKYTDDGVTSDITLYYGTYNPSTSRRIIFVYGGEEYEIYRAEDAQLSVDAFSLSAYGYGEASDYVYSLEENGNSFVDITQLSLSIEEFEVTIYVFDA